MCWGVRYASAQAMGQIGPDAREAVPALIEALMDTVADVRYWSALALGRIGPEAKAAVPTLISPQGRALECPVRECQARAVGPYAKEPSLPSARRQG